MGFRRFNLRGRDKVELEWGLVTLACNVRRLFRLRGGNLMEIRDFRPVRRKSLVAEWRMEPSAGIPAQGEVRQAAGSLSDFGVPPMPGRVSA